VYSSAIMLKWYEQYGRYKYGMMPMIDSIVVVIIIFTLFFICFKTVPLTCVVGLSVGKPDGGGI